MNSEPDSPSAKGGQGPGKSKASAEAFIYNNDGSVERMSAKGASQKPGAAQSPNVTTVPAGKPVKSAAATPPAEAMPGRIHTVDATAEDIADDLADLIEAKMMALLRQKLDSKGGRLNEADLKKMREEFRAQLTDIKSIFLDAVDSYAKSETRRDHAKEDRKNTFRRIMVSRFESRFGPDRSLWKEPSRLSRRILPGFFSALSLMLGPESMESLNWQANAVKEDFKKKLGDKFAWPEVYKSADARRLSLKAEIQMAQHFTDIDKRIDWLVTVINGNMIPLPANQPGANWEFTESAARKLLRDLFSEVRKTIRNAGARAQLAKRVDARTMGQLDALAAAL